MLWAWEWVCFLAWLVRISHILGCSDWFSDRQIIRVNKTKWDYYKNCWEKSTLFCFFSSPLGQNGGLDLICCMATPKQARVQLDGPVDTERSGHCIQLTPFLVFFMGELVSFQFESSFLISGIDTITPEIFNWGFLSVSWYFCCPFPCKLDSRKTFNILSFWCHNIY